MAGKIRRDQNKRESWNVKNLTKKTISIGDLPTVPTFNPGQTHDILKFVTREKASHSTDLVDLLNAKWVRLKKVDPTRTKTVISANHEKATLPATREDASSGGDSGGATLLGDLTDVDLTGLVDDDFLQYDLASGNWEPVASVATVNDIDDVGNVDTLGVQDNDILYYDLGSLTWVVGSG